MIRIAYFQPFSGASGDMVLGALVDAGLDPKAIEEGLRSLGVSGWRIQADKVLRGAFAATRLRVVHHHHHDHGGHGHGHGHGEEEEGGHHHHHAHHHHHHEHTPPSSRNLPEILRLIAASRLPDAVKEAATRVFRRLGEAEARVHGIPVDSVHFHEVGAVDSIVDIVGSCLGLNLMGVQEIHSAPVTVGTGFVRGAHGRSGAASVERPGAIVETAGMARRVGRCPARGKRVARGATGDHIDAHAPSRRRRTAAALVHATPVRAARCPETVGCTLPAAPADDRRPDRRPDRHPG